MDQGHDGGSSMRKVPEWGFAASPYSMGNLLIIEAGATFALNKLTGDVVWKSQDYRAAYGSPISFSSGDKKHIAVLKTDGLVILDGSNGKTLAFTKWETSYRTNASTPLLRETRFSFPPAIAVDVLFSMGWTIPIAKSENKNLSTHMNHAILVEDYLYGFDGNVHMAGPKDFACIQFSTGKEQWRVTDRGLQVGSLIVAGDRMLMLGQRENV